MSEPWQRIYSLAPIAPGVGPELWFPTGRAFLVYTSPFDPASDKPIGGVERLPLWRWYDGATDTHYYTLNPADPPAASGWTKYESHGYLLPSDPLASLPASGFRPDGPIVRTIHDFGCSYGWDDEIDHPPDYSPDDWHPFSYRLPFRDPGKALEFYYAYGRGHGVDWPPTRPYPPGHVFGPLGFGPRYLDRYALNQFVAEVDPLSPPDFLGHSTC